MYTNIYVYIHKYIYIYVSSYTIYPDELRGNPPPRFFTEIANLFWVWGAEPPPGTHGKLHARCTVLHGGGSEPPPGT